MSERGSTPYSEGNMEPLPPVVQEAIDTYAKYYAEHHKLGMSIRDDMRYVASVALRWKPDADGGFDIAQELRTVLAWESARMGAMSSAVLKQVIERVERSAGQSETAPQERDEIVLLTAVLNQARATLLISLKGTPEELQSSLGKLNLKCKAHWDWQTTRMPK